MKARSLVEVCTGSLSDSVRAFEAGSNRIELNSSLELGGLSASPGTLIAVIESIEIPVIAMVRPRSGSFVYSYSEKKAMLLDTEFYLSNGAAGIAVGAFAPEGGIDTDFVTELRKLAGKNDLVFHRAFDLLPDQFQSLAILAELGVDRILTSGGCRTAWEGRNTIRELINRYGEHIEIMPGSGINSANADAVVKHTGCSQLHGSFSKKKEFHQSVAKVLTSYGIETSYSEIKRTISNLSN
ncbi:MAG: copper homeostasis protein CutC [Candidatus Sabulitectum sp.]|nr:copper homeostasis protein CutC [Candidatus Sabulitectum sp.]